MSSLDSKGKGKYPQDLVAIFHASFHPTKGNVIDWSLTASDDLCLRNVEFTALPSGLHLVDQDVVYFSRDSHHGVCIYQRRPTTEMGRRGFHFSSLGIMLAKSARPRPWKHVAALKELSASLYSRFDVDGTLDLSESDWDPAITFFNERKARGVDLGDAGDWDGWNHELDGIQRTESEIPDPTPTLHLSHLLRILGPSSLTLYKHVLGRRRILVYTLPPVEAACILCHVAADMCFEVQHDASSADVEGQPRNDGETQRLQGRCKEPISVLGMVTLNDADRMKGDGNNGGGWIACTTDAIFLEKPSYYDLLIDLTTSTPSKATRPTFYLSRPVISNPTVGKGPTHRLSVIRFVWSDIKLWNELDRILRLDAGGGDSCCCNAPNDVDGKTKLVSTWTDVWRVYEDVCMICAGLWMGTWRNNPTMSCSTDNDSPSNWGSIRLQGDDDLTVDGSYVRNLGMGIEGKPSPVSGSFNVSGTASPSTPSKRSRKTSKSSRKATTSIKMAPDRLEAEISPGISSADVSLGQIVLDREERRDRHIRTTLALLQTFHANACFQLSRMQIFLSNRAGTSLGPETGTSSEKVIYLTPKDVLSFDLGPLSGFDSRYLEWLFAEYASGTRVVVKRGWRDIFGLLIAAYG